LGKPLCQAADFAALRCPCVPPLVAEVTG